MGVDIIYDNLDSTGEGPIVVEATVTLLPQDKGGKSRPITKGYRPNHNFGRTENRNMYIGQIELREGEFMHPGETRDVCFTFLNVRGLAEKLVAGTTWRLQEGTRLVGTAEVKRVIHEA